MLNWFYFTTSTAVHKQFIPNPSITFKCKFPFFLFWDIRNSTSATNSVLHPYFCLGQRHFFMLFYIKFNFGFNVWLQGTSLHNVPMPTAAPAALSALRSLWSSGFTHSLCRGSEQNAQSLQAPRRHPCTAPNQRQPPQQTLWLPPEGLRAEWEGLLLLLTYNQFSLHYIIT